MAYRPTTPGERVEALTRWHERAYRELRDAGERRVRYLGLDLGARSRRRGCGHVELLRRTGESRLGRHLRL